MIVGWGVELLATYVENLCALKFLSEENENLCIKKKQYFLTFLITILITWINSLKILSLFPMFLYIAYFSVIAFVFYKTEWVEKVLFSLGFLILIAVSDYFSVTILSTLFNSPSFIRDVMETGTRIRVLYLIFDKGMLVVGMLILKRHFKIYIIQQKYKFIIALGIVTIYLVYVTCNFSGMYALFGWSLFVLIGSILMLLVFYYNKWKDVEAMKELLNLKNNSYMDYYGQLCEQHKAQEKKLHDVRYQYITLGQLLQEKKYEQCLEYLGQISSWMSKSFTDIYTGNQYIDFLLNYKKCEAENKDIQFIIDSDIVGEAIEMSQEDINVILGNLLDNAVEACERIHEEVRWIEIKVNKVRGMFFLTIKNSSRCAPVVENGRIVTEKENIRIHGLGLQNVRDCVEKCGGTFAVRYNDHVFTAEVTIF